MRCCLRVGSKIRFERGRSAGACNKKIKIRVRFRKWKRVLIDKELHCSFDGVSEKSSGSVQLS